MPQIALTTNLEKSDQEKADFRKRLSSHAADMLNKPESYCMIITQFGCQMSFAGTDEPTATVEVSSLGLADEDIPGITQSLFNFLHSALDLQPSRVYIRFSSPPRSHWAWNEKTFG